LLRPALGAVAFFILAPGTVAGLVPWLLSRGGPDPIRGGGLRVAGGLLAAAGVASLVESFVRFVRQGRGTPAPQAPPKELVVSGQFRFVRNPMYLAILAIVLGQAAARGRLVLLAYAAALFGAFHLRVVRYEEPTLARQFGEAFENYRRHVPRWRPRRTAWRNGGA
jgi:protein-S-isoprenylcysteine O-methyltransferase Ste14